MTAFFNLQVVIYLRLELSTVELDGHFAVGYRTTVHSTPDFLRLVKDVYEVRIGVWRDCLL